MKQLTEGRRRPKYRLSPNEVEQLKKQETERRRKLRIVQVREQSKAAAATIRQNVKHERKRQLVKLAQELEGELEEEQREEVRRLEQRYDNTLRTIGQGHTQAVITDKRENRAEKHVVALQNRERAQERHTEALRKLTLDKAYKEYDDTKHLRDRQAALLEEKKRAAEVASRPPPPPDPISDVLLSKHKKKPVPLTDMNAFSSTHYHVPDFAVEKAPPQQQNDGKAAGDEEDQRTREEVSERQKKQHDQIIRARIRGNEALKKEKLKHEFDSLMADLSHQQRTDRRQRQLVVSKLPKQVFLPPDRRLEELDDKQLEMERAFEDMYMKQINLSGDLSLTLDPHPLPQTPGDESLEVPEDNAPVVIPTMPSFNPALRELTNVSRSQGQTTEPAKPDTVLKKLLTKIKKQRTEADPLPLPTRPGQENRDSAKSDKAGRGREEPSAAVARTTRSKPQADPQLDLSPMKAAGNQKPVKSLDVLAEEETEDSTIVTDMSETGFLEQLQGRLQAIEMQKDQLDRMMRQRQRQQQQPPPPSMFPTTATMTQHSTIPHLSSHLSTTSTRPQEQPQDPGLVTTGQPPLTLYGGPAGDVGLVQKAEGEGFPYQAVSTRSAMYQAAPPTVTPQAWSVPSGVAARSAGLSLQGSGFAYSTHSASLAGQAGPHVLPSSLGLDSHARPGLFAEGRAISSTSYPEGRAVSGAYPGMISTGGTISSSSATYPGMLPAGGAVSTAYPGFTAPSQLGTILAPQQQTTSLQPIMPRSGFSLPTQSWSSASREVTASVQAPPSSSSQPSSVLAWLHSRQLASDAQSRWQDVSTRGTGYSGARDLFDGSKSAGLGAGREAERLQKLREYQQQLVAKHQERVSAVRDNTAPTALRYTNNTGLSTGLSGGLPTGLSTGLPTGLSTGLPTGLSTGLLSSQPHPATLAPYTLKTASFQPNPVSLVPYTLKTSALQPDSTLTSSGTSTAPLPPTASSLPLPVSGQSQAGSSSLHGFAPLTRSLGPGPSSIKPLASGGDGVEVFEPILAGSSGVTVRAEPKPSSPAGPPPKLGSNGASSLDPVRKSLPFDDLPDESAGPDGLKEGESMADDSQLSSCTEGGSPVLASRSNKSSTSGKSGSGLSAMSDGSLGGSSLVARAEENRLGFEQRQKELQNQLAEIQRQKEALLQRYHGNQQRVSAQEESLRSKLKTAKAASSAPVSLWGQPVSAVSLGVHQSASPSMELEERSLSSEPVSASRSWAMELEEYSLSHSKSGEGHFKSPGSMTLEEVSITSERSTGPNKDASKMTDRSGVDLRPGSSLSSLEEYSIVSGKHSGDLDLGVTPPSASTADSTSSRQGRDPDALQLPLSGRGPLEVSDLSSSLASEQREGSNTGGATSWAQVLALPQSEDNESTRLPPPPTRQPLTITDYEPHELSTILEVDTPQTASKPTTFTTAPQTNEDSEKQTSRRYIDFHRHGATTDDERVSESNKFSASGSSGSSDVRSVIEVRPGLVKSEGTYSTLGSGEDLFSLRGGEQRFRENILEASSMKEIAQIQGGTQQDLQPAPSQDLSYVSSGQGFQSLELTLDSLTPRSVSVEDSQARRYLDFSAKESAGEGREGESDDAVLRQALQFNQEIMTGEERGESADAVLRQARQFNQEMMASIKRQSADVFDQSSVSSVSHSATD